MLGVWLGLALVAGRFVAETMEITQILTALFVYAVCTVAFLPGLALTLAYGAIYGAAVGGILSLTGATLGAAVAAAVARRYLKTTLLARLLEDPEPGADSKIPARLQQWQQMLRALYAMIDRYGVRTVIITRLTPVFPFNVLNYLLGLTTLPIWQISALSFVCMAPACFVYAWIGAAGASVFSEGDPRYLLLVLAGVAVLLAIKPLSARVIDYIKRRD